jgi:hypothetical protein
MRPPSINFSFIFLFIAQFTLFAQDVTTVTSSNEDINDNLDLEAVTPVFGESKGLEDFEKRHNDPNTQISNLDLNNDGEVDYLRVMETADRNVHTICIQSIIAKDQYQILQRDKPHDKPQNPLAVVIQDLVAEHLALPQERHLQDPVLEEQDINN